MKNILIFLSVLVLALSSCHDKKTDRIYFPFSKDYQVYYDKNRDSLHCSASFTNNYGSMLLDQNQSITVNNYGASYQQDYSYHWLFDGKQDITFRLNDRGNESADGIKASDIKTFEVALPDTISMAQWKSIKITGPEFIAPEFINIMVNFANNYKQGVGLGPQSGDSVLLNSNFFNYADTGKAVIDLNWTNNNLIQLQNSYPGSYNKIGITTHTQKQIYLKP